MTGGSERCTLSVCVHSAELDSAAHGAYCKLYVDANDMSNGSSGHHGGGGGHNDLGGDRDSGPAGSRSFHTHADRTGKKTHQPTWDETFSLDIRDRRQEILTIRLKSKKLLHVSVVGACAIPLRQIPAGRTVDQWFPVQKGGKRRGRLRLQLTVTYASTSAPTATASSSTYADARSSSITSPYESSPYQQQSYTSPQQLFDNDRRRSSNASQQSSVYQRASSMDRRSSRTSSVTDMNGADDYSAHRTSDAQRSRPSSLASRTLESTPEEFARRAPPPARPQSASSSSYRYQPEEEPVKDKPVSPPPTQPAVAMSTSPLPPQKTVIEATKTPTLYRPSSRLELESDDDDEASFPRVAELHRLESDLIGESSDEEEVRTLEPKASQQNLMEPVVEGTASPEQQNRSTNQAPPNFVPARFTTVAAVATAEKSMQQHVAGLEQEEVRRLEAFEHEEETLVALEVHGNATASSSDDRGSIEILRRTRVVVPKDEIPKILDNEMTKTTTASFVSASSDAQPQENKPTAGADVEVWNRYPSSSSSEELELPYPDEDHRHTHTTQSSDAVDAPQPVVADDTQGVNPFVEPASPSDSDHEQETPVSVEVCRATTVGHASADARFAAAASPRKSSPSGASSCDQRSSMQERFDLATTPRASTIDTAQASSSASPSRHEGATSPRSSTSSTEHLDQFPAVTGHAADSPAKDHSFVSESTDPRHSWVSEKPDSVRNRLDSQNSWVSENLDDERQRTVSTSQHSWISERPSDDRDRIRTESQHSWVSEHPDNDRDRAASVAHSWISEHPENDRPRTASANHSWISEHPETDRARTASANHSWISENPDNVRVRTASANHSWISEKPDNERVRTVSQHSWISDHPENERDRVRTVSQHSWVSESPEKDRVRAASSTSWVSEASASSRQRLDSRQSTSSDRLDPARQRLISQNSWISEGEDEDEDNEAESSTTESNSASVTVSVSAPANDIKHNVTLVPAEIPTAVDVDEIIAATQHRESTTSIEDADVTDPKATAIALLAAVSSCAAEENVPEAPVDVDELMAERYSSSSSEDLNAPERSMTSVSAAKAAEAQVEAVDVDQLLNMSPAASSPDAPRTLSDSMSSRECVKASMTDSSLPQSPRDSLSSEDIGSSFISTGWVDEPAANEELMDVLRRISHVSAASDPYENSPRPSDSERFSESVRFSTPSMGPVDLDAVIGDQVLVSPAHRSSTASETVETGEPAESSLPAVEELQPVISVAVPNPVIRTQVMAPKAEPPKLSSPTPSSSLPPISESPTGAAAPAAIPITTSEAESAPVVLPRERFVRLASMSLRMAPAMLATVADDCLPSDDEDADDDDDDSAVEDGDFNFDSDSD